MDGLITVLMIHKELGIQDTDVPFHLKVENDQRSF